MYKHVTSAVLWRSSVHRDYCLNIQTSFPATALAIVSCIGRVAAVLIVKLLLLIDRSSGDRGAGTSPFLSRLSQDEVVSGGQGTSSKHGGGTAGNSGQTSVPALGESGASKGNDWTGGRSQIWCLAPTVSWNAAFCLRSPTRSGHRGSSEKVATVFKCCVQGPLSGSEFWTHFDVTVQKLYNRKWS